MKASFILSYPWWFILFCICFAIIGAYIIYGKKKYIVYDGESKWLKYILFALRSLALFLIAFLLLTPLLKSKQTKKEKPTIILLQDNTLSLKNNIKNKDQYFDDVEQLKKAIQKDYDLLSFNFGDVLQSDAALNFNEQQTDINAVIDNVFTSYDNKNLGAVIIASDGIFNKGSNPLYNKNAKKIPFYTIGLGDTTIQKDAYISLLQCPEVVYLGDKLNLQIEIEANKLNGKTTVLQVINPSGKVIYNQTININSDYFQFAANVVDDANKVGVVAYTVVLKPVAGEVSKANNQDKAYVEVIDGRQKIALIYDAPHPDISAIKSTIKNNKNYDVDVFNINEFNDNITPYDLLILHGIPSSNTSNKNNQIKNWLNNNKSVLIIVSANTNLSLLNTIQDNLKINGSSLNGNDVYPIYQSSFSKFILTDETLKRIKNLPPLLAPFGKYTTSNNVAVLFNQQIGKVATNNPLWCSFDVNNKKIGFICAEGIWRWKINEFAQYKNNDATNELLDKTIQFLTVKSDKRRFIVHTEKNIYNSNESIDLNAVFYNESYMLVNESDVNATIKSTKGKTYNFSFDKTANSYVLNAGVLPVGDYTVVAATDYKGKSYKAATQFSVKPIIVELINTQANYNLLRSLALQSGGQFFYPNQLANIPKALENNKAIHTVLYDSFKTRPLIDWKFLFVLIVLLLGAEWFIRKYNGVI
ncbi:MAG: hypothetical protein H6553_07165 [Chitinophagales bacterium]|nr:hypothetical protein [Chitinophagales bacterium]